MQIKPEQPQEIQKQVLSPDFSDKAFCGLAVVRFSVIKLKKETAVSSHSASLD